MTGGAVETGEIHAFVTLYHKFEPAVRAYVRRRTAGSEVDDVVSETFLVVWRRIDDLPQGDKQLPWVYGVARRVVATRRRGSARQGKVVDQLLNDRSRGAHVVKRRSEGDLIDHLTDAILCLNDTDRQLLVMAYWESRTAREIAEALSCSTNAVWIRLHRARKRLAEEMRIAGVWGSAARGEPVPERQGMDDSSS